MFNEQTRSPENYEELQQRLLAEHPTLSKRLKQIAEYALRHPHDMALENISALSKRVQVTPSSLVRFAQALGYDGFTQMQRVFRDGLKESIPDYQSRLRLGRGMEKSEIGTGGLELFIQGAEQGLRSLRQSVREDDLEAAAKLLAGGNRIHVLAQRRAFPVASYLAYAFNHLNRPAHLLDGIGGLLQEQEKTVLTEDVLVAISFTPYSMEVRQLVENVYHRGTPVLALTDSRLSPLVPYSSQVLEIQETEVLGFRTLSSTMCLSLALIVELGQRLDAGTQDLGSK